MAGFLTGCCDASKVLVPMLDTIIQCKIREEEAAYIATLVGKSFNFLGIFKMLTDDNSLANREKDSITFISLRSVPITAVH